VHQPVVVDAGLEVDRAVEPQPFDDARSRLPSLGLPITTSSQSRSVRSLARASSNGTRPLSGMSELVVTMMRPGTWPPRGAVG